MRQRFRDKDIEADRQREREREEIPSVTQEDEEPIKTVANSMQGFRLIAMQGSLNRDLKRLLRDTLDPSNLKVCEVRSNAARFPA